MENINSEILQYLYYCQEKLKLQPGEMRVLDYGCGAGQSVLSLKLAGYQAFGVDIDADAVSAGRKLLDKHGFNGREMLFSFDENTRIPFDENFFHFIMSQEVIEHVSDVSVMARDLRRVSAPGSVGFHVFRPQYNFIEPHFFMPLVHWFPKNRLRKYAILFHTHLGIGTHPPQIPGAGPKERAEFLYRYSINQTFYRPYPLIGGAFRNSGFGICFPITNHTKIRKSKTLSVLSKILPFGSLMTWMMMTFHNAYLLTQTPDAKGIVDTQIQIGNWKSELLV